MILPCACPACSPPGAGKEGQYEREGYGDRVLDNWEKVTIMRGGGKILWDGGCTRLSV